MKVGVMIPIKEQSQRVPGKTFRTLGNKSLAYWIVDTLLKLKPIFDLEIWINTDSDMVVDLYREGGYDDFDLQYYIRPFAVRGHDVSMNKVIQDWIENCGEDYRYYLQTHITNPFVSEGLLEEALDSMEYYSQGSHTSVMGVTRHQCRMWYNGRPVNFTLGEVIQTQDLLPVYEDNSCFYAFDNPGFYQWGRVSPMPDMVEVPWPENMDIDTEEDWELASKIAEHLI